MKISVVVPVYGCPEALEPLCGRLKETLLKITKSYEIILVNDGCPKGSWEKIVSICSKDKKVIGINLSRNFGQIHATNAGLTASSGEYVVLMDCDLQDRPEGILDLYKNIEDGYDIVFAKRVNRKDNFLTKFLSKSFYKMYNYFVDGYYDGDIANFCIAKRKIVDEYNLIKDNNKSYTATLSWMGYDVKVIGIESDKRFEGNSSYNLKRKINLAIDMITSQSNRPLKSVIKIGVSISAVSLIYMALKIICYFLYQNTPEGWTSTIAAVFLMGGITISSLGMTGLYVGNIFNQTKDIPEYLIKETINARNKR